MHQLIRAEENEGGLFAGLSSVHLVYSSMTLRGHRRISPGTPQQILTDYLRVSAWRRGSDARSSKTGLSRIRLGENPAATHFCRYVSACSELPACL